MRGKGERALQSKQQSKPLQLNEIIPDFGEEIKIDSKSKSGCQENWFKVREIKMVDSKNN